VGLNIIELRAALRTTGLAQSIDRQLHRLVHVDCLRHRTQRGGMPLLSPRRPSRLDDDIRFHEHRRRRLGPDRSPGQIGQLLLEHLVLGQHLFQPLFQAIDLLIRPVQRRPARAQFQFKMMAPAA